MTPVPSLFIQLSHPPQKKIASPPADVPKTDGLKVDETKTGTLDNQALSEGLDGNYFHSLLDQALVEGKFPGGTVVMDKVLDVPWLTEIL